MTESLLDRPPATAADVAAIEQALAGLLETSRDVVLMQGEAILALEATARGLSRPGVRALNIVTGPYGALFGEWLAAGGAAVDTVTTPLDDVVTPDEVARALAGQSVDVVSVVHAEAATGGLNPVGEIAALARAAGALLVVDAVASVGAHPVTPDEWAADVVVFGAQKALSGPAGLSAAVVSDRAWAALEANPSAPRSSYLSLLDIKHGWLDNRRRILPGYVATVETIALRQAVDRVGRIGLAAVVQRHGDAARAARSGLRTLGLRPWIANDADAAHVATTVAVPAGRSTEDFVGRVRAAGATMTSVAPGALGATTLRINHTGANADVGLVEAELAAWSAAPGR